MNNLFFVAVAPGIAFALAIYLTDRYDREPVGLLVKIFVLGALSVIPTALVETILSMFNIFGGYIGIFYTSFVVAGLTEEYFKRIVVVKFALFHEAFNEKLDGIVYCAFSALGFATVENVMYVVFRFSTNPAVGIMRGILSVPAHMLFGVTMGYYLSLAKYADTEEERRKYFKRSLYVPVIFHGIFNFILMSGSQWLMVIFLPFVLFLWVTNLRKLRRYWKISRNDYLNNRDDDNMG